MCCYYFGILVLLTVFSINHVQSKCEMESSQEIMNEITASLSSISTDSQYVDLYHKMEEEDQTFMQYLFDCEDPGKLFDNWNKQKIELLGRIKKSCPDFESSHEEIERCRLELDVYNFNKDQPKYCNTFKKCSDMHGRFCSPLKELVLLENQQSNASVTFCTIECDDISELRKMLANCWASVQTIGKSSSQNYDLFAQCLLHTPKPTCSLNHEIIRKIFPLFSDKADEIISRPVTEKPESKCILEWKVLKDIENLTPKTCRMLEDMKKCITQFLGANDKRYKEKLAKCQYSVVNMIKTEALIQPTGKSTSAPSTAAGRLGSGASHLAVICSLVVMVTYYFSETI